MLPEKEQFRTEAVVNGWQREAELPPGMPTCAGRWLVQMLARPVTKRQSTPRLMNPFMLGADPEFQLQHVKGTQYDLDGNPVRSLNYPAEGLALKTGLAYGADMNGRLVEIRPAPSRFALEVVASMLATLRWMAVLVPKSREFVWKAGAWTGNDGLGGHVHFGRKAVGERKRTREVIALDELMGMLVVADVFPRKEVQSRYTHTKYGRPRDIRPQVHGYEYRTFPSWLGSPWESYLAITLSKLALMNPDLVIRMAQGQVDKATLRAKLRNLLAFYKGLDDDAAIAYQGLTVHGWPQPTLGDFKANWGLLYGADVVAPKVQVLPTSINPTEDEVCELRGHFTKGSALPAVVPVPNWRHLIPAEFQSVIAGINTHGLKGMGELTWDLVVHKDYPIKFSAQNGPYLLIVSMELERLVPRWKELIPKELRALCYADDIGGYTIQLGVAWREDPKKLAIAKELIMRAGFPVWSFMDVQPDSLAQWRAAQRLAPVAVEEAREGLAGKVRGELIFGEKG